MNLQLIDWLILGGVIFFLLCVAFYTQRLSKSVSDFLSANRCAGRYLLTMAQQMSGVSAIIVIAAFEKFYRAGFCAMWWSSIMAPISITVALSGFVIYRYRETRAMTMAQFFQIRYSRNFRVFAGLLAFLSGILNYGIFPAVTARFIVYFAGFPEHFFLFGFNVATFPCVMLVMLSLAVAITISGGQITVMVTDFLQGQFANIVFVVLLVFLLCTFSWDTIIETLRSASSGNSMIHPFKQAKVLDFNAWYFLILGFLYVYQFMSWQGSQGYFSSAKSPHEARMAGILARMVDLVRGPMMVLMAICAYVLLHNLNFATDAAVVQESIRNISDIQIQTQMTVPIALTRILPAGIFGLFITMMMAASISTDDTYLHSWGSVFVQDVILPFRKKVFTPKQHIKVLRLGIIGVAVFAFFFSIFMPIKEFIYMYFQITGAIFMGGAGSVIIGGLYWKRGTTTGAWAGIITGTVFAMTGFLLRYAWPHISFLVELSPDFPVNGAQASFASAVAAILAYVIASLITCKEPFNLEKMLHRGKYAINGEHQEISDKKRNFIWRILGVGKEFTLGDKVIYIVAISWAAIWFAIFVVGTVWNFMFDVPDSAWASYWFWVIIINAGAGIIITVWYVIGGTKNLFELFSALKNAKRNELDDGTVVDHHNLSD